MSYNIIKLLAIDDNSDNLLTLKAVLSDQLTEAVIFTAQDGRKGIEIALNEDPDVVLLDITMPGLDGFDVCKILKTNVKTSSIPVIFLTAQKKDRESRIKALEVGAEGFLTKPFDEIELVSHLRAMAKIKAANRQQKLEKESLETLIKERTQKLEIELADREKAENDLRASEEFRKQVFESSRIPIVIMDGNTYKYIDCNEAAVVISGNKRKEDLLGKSPLDGWDPVQYDGTPSAEKALYFINLAKEKGSVVFEWRNKRANGEIWDGEFHLLSFKVNGKDLMQFSILDITERRLARIALEDSEERFRNIFRDNASIMFLIDPETGYFIDVNKAAEKFYGWTRDQFLKMRIQNVNLLDEKTHHEIQKVLINKQLNFEFKHKKADGSVCDVDVFSSVITIEGKKYLHSNVYDITEKKMAERQVRLLGRAVEQNSAAIIITNKDGIIQYVNKSCTRLTGYSSKELIGKNPNILKSGTHNISFYKELWNTILAGTDWQGEMQNRNKKGEIYWENVIITPLFNSNGHISHFIAIKEDITEKKQLIESLVIAKTKAEESDRLKSVFLANISHEIRTPMNGIIGFLDLLKNTEIKDDKKNKYIELVNQSGHRLLKTINDIIEISKIESDQAIVNYSDVNVREIMKFHLDFFKPKAEEKNLTLKISQEINEENDLIITDKHKLESALTNLINNSIKFTDKGSISFGNYIDNDNLVFFVSDTDHGIPADRIDAVFDRFVQADLSLSRPHEGSGLGLSITKAYIEMLNGKIWIESEVGKGSTFYFAIPYSKFTDNYIATTSNTKKEKVTKNITLLIAEDDKISFLYLKTILSGEDIIIIHTNNGNDTIMQIKENPQISLILMDLKMPGISGLDATRSIREFNTKIPIIAQTAFALAGDKEKALEAGCNDYITKPINGDELLQMIKKYIV